MDKNKTKPTGASRQAHSRVRLFAIVSLLAAGVPRTVSGQGVQVGPRVGIGDGSGFTAQVGIRA